jgi:TolB-like protein/Tfp pilus assembly protein PilF
VQFAEFVEHFTSEEHCRLRDAYQALVERQPSNATAWAHLAVLYGLEVFFSFNPLPDAVVRVRRAADRAVGIDSTHQGAWYALADAAFFERNAAAFRSAADRAIELNPLRSRTVGAIGLLRAFAGDPEEGAVLVTRAISLNPRHPGWFHLALFLDAFQRGDADRALGEAARINMPHVPVDGRLFAIAAAGRFGRAPEAAAAINELRRDHPHLLDARRAREEWRTRIWNGELLDSLVGGFEAALKAQSSALPASATGTDSSPATTGRPLGAGDAGEIPRAPSRPSIAVLPFADLSAEKNQDWFCDGIAEEILNALAHLPGLRVAGRTSAFSFRNRDDAAKAIGEKLGVSAVLEGSVRRAGDRVRVTVQLVDPVDGFQLWSERYDRELKDIFEIQDEIARSVAGRLKVALDSGMERRLIAAQTSNIEAYELYLKGRLLLSRRGASILPALDHFRRAVELDPDYAPAWAGIAGAYVVCGYFGLLPGSEVRRQGPAAARRALLLDPNSADAFAALAVLQQMCENDLDGAGAAFRKALELNPACVQARCWYAIFFRQAALGEFEEGVAEARHAKELDPLSAYTTAILSAALVNARRPAEAVEEARKAVAIDPESFVGRWMLGRALFHANQLDEAETVLERSAAMSGRHPFALVTLAKTYAAKGQRDRARALHEELVQRSGTGVVPAAELMLTADAAGDREQALAYARQALDNRDLSFMLLVRHWRDYAELRQDARFAALIRALDAPNAGAIDR